MSKNGVVKFRLIVDFDAIRARFDKEMFINLAVWDEIRGEYIRVTPDEFGNLSDLTRPGEGFRELRIELRKDD